MILVFRKDYFSAIFLFVIVVFSLWITPDFVVSGKVLPNFIPFFLSLFAVLFLLDCKLGGAAFRAFLCMFLCVFLSIICVPYVVDMFFERLSGAVQIVLSFFVFFVSSELYKKVNKDFFVKLLLCFWLFLIVLSILEFYGITNSVVKDIRYFLYSKSVYESSIRDVVQYGVVRPITLMREPAHLALLLSVLSLVLSLSYRRHGIFLILFSFLIILYVVRSPLVVLMPAAYLSIVVLTYEGSLYRKIMLLFFVFFATGIFILLGAYFFQSRIVNIMDGVDFSAASRLLAPPVVAFNVISDYPVFGVGPTADSLMYLYIYDVFQNFGFDYQLKVFDEAVISKRVTNYFFLNFIYFGFVGGFFIIIMLWRYFRYDLSRMASASVLISFTLFGFAIGSYVTPVVWVILFLIFIGVKQYCFDAASHR